MKSVEQSLLTRASSDRIHFGLIANNLSFGGNTRFMLDLIRAMDPKWFDCLGIALINLDKHILSLEEAERFTSLSSYNPNVWQDCPHKLALYAGCFPDVPVKNATSVFISNSSSDYIQQLSSKAKAFVDYWIAVSPAAASVLPMPKIATVLIPGVDLDRCRPVVGRELVRKKWGLQEHHKAIGYIGRIVRDGCKVIDIIAKAARILGESFVPVFVGPVSDLKLKEAILGFCPRSIFVLETTAIGDILSALDCFVLVSRCEGCSLALLEAWAAGVPTVITNVGGVPYFEETYGSFGVHVSLDENDKELAEAITKALAAENKPTIRRAKEVVSSIYNLEEFGRRWTEYLIGVISGKILKNEPFVPSETGVSIITSVYNTNPKYLDEFWSSLQRQTWKHWELILVDDGSSQTATIDKLKEIATDPRVRLILLPENKGASTALNIGLKEARHNLIAIMDSDDMAEPTWLARMVAAVKANPDVDICGCQLRAFDDTTGQTQYFTNHSERIDYSLLIRMALDKKLWFMNHGGAIYKRKSILQLGGYDPELRYCCDLDLWLRAFESGLTIINIPDVLVHYRRHSDAQLTRHPDSQKTADKLRLGFIRRAISKNSIRTWTPEPDL